MSETESPNYENEDTKPNLDYLTAKDIQNKVVAGIFKLKQKEGRSKVWTLFCYVEDAEGNRLQNVIACKACFKIFRAARGITSNLSKHKCFIEANDDSQDSPKPLATATLAEHQEKVAELYLDWITSSCRPLDIINDEGFRNYIHCILQSASTMGKNLTIEAALPPEAEIKREMTYLYKKYFDETKAALYEIVNSTYCLSVSLWEDENIDSEIIVLMIHFIKDDRLVTKFLGIKKIPKDICTDLSVITQQVEKLLQTYEFYISQKALFLTNSSKVVSSFSHNFHVTCMHLLLTTTIEACLNQAPLINEMYTKLLEILRSILEMSPSFDTTLKLQEYATKNWKSVYKIFSYFESNWSKINSVWKLEDIDLELMCSVNKILKIFDDACRKLKDSATPTLHLVVIYVHNLRKVCRDDKCNKEVIKNLRTTLNTFVHSLLLPNCSVIHKIALYLFPPAKKLLTLEPEEQLFVKAECLRLIKTIRRSESTALNNWSTSMLTSTPVKMEGQQQRETNEMACLEMASTSGAFTSAFQPETINDQLIQAEMEFYELKESPFHKDFDILQWWSSNRIEFPNLYKLSCWIHAVPATCLSGEQLFLKVKTLIFNGSYDLTTDLQYLNKLIYLQYNANNSTTNEL